MSMSIRHECPRCRKTGFVRAERVFKAGNGVTEFVCGACDYNWVEHDETTSSEVQETQS
jgi:transposase-like protein